MLLVWRNLLPRAGGHCVQSCHSLCSELLVCLAWSKMLILVVFSVLQYSTADYPVKGILAYRLNTEEPQFNGRSRDEVGARVIADTIYYDRSPTLITVHGVDKVMVPIKFF